jgi:inner membrane organizing system protein 1
MIKQGSDELLSRKYDQCLARLIVNGGIGLATGVGLSVILFRRRFWPIPLSFGFSAGTPTIGILFIVFIK